VSLRLRRASRREEMNLVIIGNKLPIRADEHQGVQRLLGSAERLWKSEHNSYSIFFRELRHRANGSGASLERALVGLRSLKSRERKLGENEYARVRWNARTGPQARSNRLLAHCDVLFRIAPCKIE